MTVFSAVDAELSKQTMALLAGAETVKKMQRILQSCASNVTITEFTSCIKFSGDLYSIIEVHRVLLHLKEKRNEVDINVLQQFKFDDCDMYKSNDEPHEVKDEKDIHDYSEDDRTGVYSSCKSKCDDSLGQNNEKYADINCSDDVLNRSNEEIDGIVEEKVKVVKKRAPSLYCQYCPFVGQTLKKARKHEQRCCRIFARKFVCPVCDKSLGYSRDLKRHMACHEEAKFQCRHCDKKYRHEADMIEHAKCHDDTRLTPRHECHICHRVLCSKPVLKLHMKRLHDDDRTRYLCQTCGKQFYQKKGYQQHIAVHLGVKPYICDICGVSFAYVKSFKEHSLMHTNIRQFKCDICDKTFRQRSGLYIHRKIHNDSPEYICSYCDRGFKQKSSLVRHERIHVGSKPYSCNICRAIFRDTSVIRRHILMVHKLSSKTWKDAMTRSPVVSNYFVTPKNERIEDLFGSDDASFNVDIDSFGQLSKEENDETYWQRSVFDRITV